MHVVTVLFTIQAAHYPNFLSAMLQNAATSLADEPGCSQFDVCEGTNHTIFLYEIYADAAAFELHLASKHFVAFNQKTAPWVANKQVQIFSRCEALP